MSSILQVKDENGNWIAVPSLTGKKGDKGDTGAKGATFIPSVDSSGNLSWTNDGGLANPASFNIVNAVLAVFPDGDGVSY